MSHLLLARRKASSLAFKFAVGATVAAPLVAISQATFFLLNYRINHADAPRPVCPSRGALVVRQQSASSSSRDEIRIGSSSQPPLRLLVIGDSLAMGIGVSRSAAPVLPVSIAQSLSKALGGRVVEWTCHGKPGLSAAKLTKEIEAFHKEEMPQFDDDQEMVEQGDRDEIAFVQNTDTPSDSNAWKRWRALLHKQRDPKISGNYDAIVVIVGMGDLKAAALPFLHVENPWNKSRRFRENLVRIKNILLRKTADDEGDLPTGVDHSLVVFPALPARPVPIFQWAPLSWFVIPLLENMDHDKRAVSDTYSDNVVFVEEPTSESIVDFEEERSSLNAMLQKDDVTFGLMDPAVHDSYREQLANKGLLANTFDEREGCSETQNEPLFQKYFFTQRNAGATLVAPDNIHPNRNGYDFWGRHIASQILRRWEKDRA